MTLNNLIRYQGQQDSRVAKHSHLNYASGFMHTRLT